MRNKILLIYLILGSCYAFNEVNSQGLITSEFKINFPGFTTRTKTTNYFASDSSNNLWIVNPELTGFTVLKLNKELHPLVNITCKINLSTVSSIHFVKSDNFGNLVILGKLRNNFIFVTKLNPDGDLLWSKYFQSNNTHELSSISISPSGNIFILSLDNFGQTSQTTFYMVLGPNGNIINQNNVNVSFGDYYGLFGSCHTDDNGFIATGTGPNIQTQDRSSTWIVKIDSLGNIEWSKLITVDDSYPSRYGIYGVTIDRLKKDKYLVMGRFGDDKNANNPNPSEMSGLIIEINGSGEILKSNKIISTNGIFLNTVGAFEKDEEVYISATQSYSEIGNSLILFSLDSSNNIIKSSNTNLNLRHPDVFQFGTQFMVGAYNFQNNSLSYHTLNRNLYYCGSNPISLEVIPIEVQQISHSTEIKKNIQQFQLGIELSKTNCLLFNDILCSPNSIDSVFQRNYTTGGSGAKIQGIDSVYCSNSNPIDLSSMGSPAGGTFELNGKKISTLDFSIIPPNSINILHYKLQNGNCNLIDSIIFKVIPAPNIDFTYFICQGDSVLINGIYYKNEISFVDTISSIDDCDTLINYNILIHPPGQINISAQLCKGKSIIIGNKTYSTSGQFTDTLRTPGQCDSIYNISIIELPIDSINKEYQLCYGDTINIENHKYFTEGQFELKDQNMYGCDSITFVNIIINYYNFDQKSYTICHGDSILINGIYFKNEISFVDTNTSVDYCDTIVNYNVQYLPYSKRNISMEICRGESIFIGNKTYSTSGQFADTIMAVGHCDSIYNISIIELPTDSIYKAYHICHGDTIIVDNSKFFAQGQYKFSNQNIHGCDSLTILNIFVNNYKIDQKSYSICQGDSIQLNGIYYKVETQFKDTLPSMVNCDTIVEYRIQLLPYGLRQQTIKLCQGDTFYIGKNKYFNTGNYIDTLRVPGKCDSIVLTNIEQARVSVSNTALSLCDGDSIIINGEYFSTGGEYTFIYQNSDGCDSTVKYQLLVLPTSTFNLDTFLCEGEILKIGNYSISNPGVYKLMFQNQHQCDSLLETRVISKLCHKIFIPNVFSPNDDLVNDHFSFYHEGVESLHVEIYDRWGSMVFNSSHIHFSWDGRFKGKDCITGVYAYVIKGRYNNSQEFLFKGDVTLIR
ncbi:MAG: gliding motility-associated C-terminal domain-containing protein [Saprospiraceae bacterium]|nr:gliding motility-associated C-terminal domain-containing protein [Saprospiraceae bacterium]